MTDKTTHQRSGPATSGGYALKGTGPAGSEMRRVLGHFMSGVVVVTALAEGPVGFTCQAFASLSLDPPLVTFSPSRSSRTWPQIRRIGRLCINVLAEDHGYVSDAFGKSVRDKFTDISWRPAPSGAPVLGGVAAWIDCVLVHEYPGGDHTIAVARVVALDADAAKLPLCYYRGGYGLPGVMKDGTGTTM